MATASAVRGAAERAEAAIYYENPRNGVTARDVTYGWTAMQAIQRIAVYNEGYGVTGGWWSGTVSSDSHVGLLSGPPHRYLQLSQNSP